jgi:hypothetical protein
VGSFPGVVEQISKVFCKSVYMGTPVVLMLGLRGTPALCILESPYSLGGLKPYGCICLATSSGSDNPTFYWPRQNSYPCSTSVFISKPHSLHPEDVGSMVLWNTGILPHHYMVSQPRWLWLVSVILQGWWSSRGIDATYGHPWTTFDIANSFGTTARCWANRLSILAAGCTNGELSQGFVKC